MCQCNPNVRTPFCGKPGCEWPIMDPLPLETRVRNNLPYAKYVSEPKWHALVNELEELIAKGHFSPTELHQAVDLAVRKIERADTYSP